METSTAKRVSSVLSDFKKLAPSIKEVYPAGRLENFGGIFNDRESEGGVLIENPAGDNIWVMFIDTKQTGEMDLVIHSEDKKKVIAMIKKSDGNNWLWSYAPRIRDGRNEERKAYFIKCLSSLEFIIPIPNSIEDVPKLFKQLLNIAEVRVKADDLSESSVQITEDSPEENSLQGEENTKKKYCQITISAQFGRHCSIGYIDESDDELVDAVTGKLDEEEDIQCFPLFEECGQDFYDNDQITSVYGPDMDCLSFDLNMYSDSACKNGLDMPTVLGEEDDFKSIRYSNPSFDNHLDNDEAKFIFAGAVRFEDLDVEVVIPLDESEDFNWENLFFGVFDTDETFYDGEILEVAMYLNEDKQSELLKLMIQDETIDLDDYCFEDELTEFISECNSEGEVYDTIKSNFLHLENTNCGSSASESVIVLDLDGTELYREEFEH